MTISETLGKFASTTDHIPSATRGSVTRALVDVMAAAVAGIRTTGARAAAVAAQRLWGGGAATCWFSETALTRPGAAFVNSARASMLDLDDGHRAASGHPGSSIIPAVLAAAEESGCDAGRIETAIALGYEIAIRISAARDFRSLGTMATGPWCGQGVACAVAWLRGDSPLEIANAISIAGTTAPNLAPLGYTRFMGNHVKEGIPWATVTGMSAAELAASGFIGPLDFLDNKDLYKESTLIDGLGQSWLVEGVYFKPYGCCRWAHAAIDAMLYLKPRLGNQWDDVRSIKIHTFQRALRLNNEPAPRNIESAQYSIPFSVALAALHGPEALLPITEKVLADKNVIGLARRIELHVDPELEAMFSAAVPARVTVHVGRERYEQTVRAPRGEPTNPLSNEDLDNKLRLLARGVLETGHADSLLGAIRAFGRGEARELFDALRRPHAET